DSGPEMCAGEHFAQIYGNQLVVVVTRCIKPGAQEVSIGVWSLDLDTYHWHKFEDGDRFVQGHWHYFSMAENSSRFFLFGVDEKEPDEYFSNVLTIDLQEYGISTVPPPTIGFDFKQLMNDVNTSDFIIRSNEEKSPAIHVHKIILLARWPHFANMTNSGMTEAHTSSLTIPEPYTTIYAFISFLYTDSLDLNLS
ncbi:12380_t:CDS:1, partial [Acaulospora morrowiae]